MLANSPLSKSCFCQVRVILGSTALTYSDFGVSCLPFRPDLFQMQPKHGHTGASPSCLRSYLYGAGRRTNGGMRELHKPSGMPSEVLSGQLSADHPKIYWLGILIFRMYLSGRARQSLLRDLSFSEFLRLFAYPAKLWFRRGRAEACGDSISKRRIMGSGVLHNRGVRSRLLSDFWAIFL